MNPPASKDTHPSGIKRYRIAIIWEVNANSAAAAGLLGEVAYAHLPEPRIGVYVCTEVKGRVGLPEDSMILGEIGS